MQTSLVARPFVYHVTSLLKPCLLLSEDFLFMLTAVVTIMRFSCSGEITKYGFFLNSEWMQKWVPPVNVSQENFHMSLLQSE